MTTRNEPTSSRPSSPPLEMWAGVECTVNRVGDGFFDQMEQSGHACRSSDVDRVAALGIRALRYPVLWERVAPHEAGSLDWTWSDERLGRLRELGVRPIVGLVHHGNGPSYTSLVDPRFPERLRAYARSVAERYPWVTAFTPVNEPLTTARFSGLYGHWYPHAKSESVFARALVHQCRAIILSMQAIREVTPHATLVQTEDLGRIYSTPHLAYQAELENERRWLSFDLLCGRIDAHHPLHARLLGSGMTLEELAWFRENRCPPDIMGINHYLTSDRYLDEHMARYPASSHGGNGRDQYADVEAVRARLDCPVSTSHVLRDAWERYRLPLAVTEAHLAGPREAQLRWLYEAWEGAKALRTEGVDVRAVTAWSVLGAFDWNVLVTRRHGFYEAGAYDVRAPEPRPTALARLVRKLATTGEAADEPLLELPGWWHRPDRLFTPASEARTLAPRSAAAESMAERSCRPLLILGGTGTLGSALQRLCTARGIPYHVVGRQELDLARPAGADELLARTNPWAVANAAGFVRVDDAERDLAACCAVNTDGPVALARACARHGIPFLTFSSDLVFDGRRREPYVESHPTAPLNVYGVSKARMEEEVQGVTSAALIVRTSAFFGPWDMASFVTRTLASLRAGDRVGAADDTWVSPTYVPDLVHAALDLLIDGESGIWHLANRGVVSWAELARRAAELARLPVDQIEARPMRSLGLPAPRPAFSALTSERGWIMPTLDDALERYMRERITSDAARDAA